MKHSIEERRLAVKMCKSGMPPAYVGRYLGINRNDVSVWLAKYNMFGARGLQKIPHKQFSYAEKIKIICEYHEKHVPLHAICAKYNISRSRLYVWSKIVRDAGYEALCETKHRRRPPKIKDMGRPKKQEPQTELEKLQRENEYLRAENAYLKKLRALRIEEEAQRQRSKL